MRQNRIRAIPAFPRSRPAQRFPVTHRDHQLEFEALVSEAALHEPIGSSHIMRSQVTHLIHMGERPNVVIRIVPLRVGWHPGWSGPFVIYDFPSAPSVVHFEHYSSGAFIPVEHDVREYRKAVVKIREVTLSPADSLDYLRHAGEKWEVG